MTELQRTQRAIGAAMAYLREMDAPGAVKTLQYINDILNPAPEYEEVTVTAYRIDFPDGQVRYAEGEPYEDEITDGAMRKAEVTKLTGTVNREKKRPVERSVTVRAHIIDSPVWAAGDAEGPNCPNPFHAHPECHGKSGKLTFTWLEDPAT